MFFYLKRKKERKKNIYIYISLEIIQFLFQRCSPIDNISINLNQNDNIARNPVPFIFLATLKSNVIKITHETLQRTYSNVQR